MKKLFCGIIPQVRFILRKERINSVIWVASIVFITVAVALSFNNLFVTKEDILAVVGMMETPAMLAMLGPMYGIENPQLGGLFSASVLLYTAIATAIMSVFLVVKHTRGDEENGRIEILRSLPIGRLSNLGAVLIVALIVNITLALLTGFSLALLQISSISFGGSMLYGFCIGVIGLLFSSITAIFSQVSSNSKGSLGFCLALLGLFYIVRATGDAGNETLSLVSPLGLILRTQCFVENIWYPVFIILFLALALAVLAFYLNSIRDLEQGLLPQRQGKREGSFFLRFPEGLMLRLLRNSIIAWMVSLLIIGVAYGSVMGEMEAFIDSSEYLSKVLEPPQGHTKTELFITVLIAMLAVLASIPILSGILKLTNEEKQHKIENILSKAVSRNRLMTGGVAISFTLSFLMLFCTAFGLWASASSSMDIPVSFGSILSSVIVYLPAIWLMIGLATFLTGALPQKASGILYAYLGLSFFILYLGKILAFPEFIKYFTPFGYIPQLPIDKLNFLPLIILTVISIGFTIGGYILYRKRDI